MFDAKRIAWYTFIMFLDLKPFSECSVLIVDDELMSRTLLASILEPYFGYEVVQSGKEALDNCKHSQPDLILLDMNMPDMNGLDLCRMLKADSALSSIPVIFVTATMDIESENACWSVGASDYVVKPVTASTLVHRIKNHLQNKLRTELLQKMTFKDQLTGLFNRLYLSNEIPRLIKQIARDNALISVVMIDIDFFKDYNDRYGHIQGDVCLENIASILNVSAKRPFDAAIRFGGEEFLVILPYTDRKGAQSIANALVKNVYDMALPHADGIDGRVTISAGYATGEAREFLDMGVITLVEHADIYLFEAKEQGKNRAKG
jgi:diguanylate cyclase (GGDEF)-like protein